MQTKSPIIDDLSKLAAGAAGTLHGMKREIEALVKQRVERVAADMDLVTREEFEVVKAMAEKAREENEILKKELAALKAEKK